MPKIKKVEDIEAQTARLRATAELRRARERDRRTRAATVNSALKEAEAMRAELAQMVRPARPQIKDNPEFAHLPAKELDRLQSLADGIPPKVETPRQAAAEMRAIYGDVRTGRLDADKGAKLSGMLRMAVEMQDRVDLEARLEALERVS